MASLFEVKDVDRKVYEESIRDFLPEKIIDAHTHVWKDEHTKHDASAFERVVSWPARVAKDDSVEDLIEGYRLLFPGKSVIPLIFSSVYEGDDIHAMNAYTSACARAKGFPALLYAHPTWSAAELERRIKDGGFLGVKVYLNLAPCAGGSPLRLSGRISSRVQPARKHAPPRRDLLRRHEALRGVRQAYGVGRGGDQSGTLCSDLLHAPLAVRLRGCTQEGVGNVRILGCEAAVFIWKTNN
jgi:hypothetical protein